MTDPTGIDEYIAAARPEVQPTLHAIREAVRAAVPGAHETISYRMPAFRLDRTFFYFAAFKRHIGVYPPMRQHAALRARLARYTGPKGNLQFPLAEPMPLDLIAETAVALAKEHGRKT